MLDTKLRKKITSIDFWAANVDARACRGSDGRHYSGRLIGLITDEEFAALIKSKDIQKKCFTSATIPLSEIVSYHEELEGFRLVLAVKEIDKEPVVTQTLFITERLSLISYLNTDISAGITGENGAYMLLEEETVENEA